MVERIKHERILLQRPARVFVNKKEALIFEMYCTSRDLSISGIFLNSEGLLRIGMPVEIDLEVRNDEILNLNGEVIRRIEFGDREHPPGFAVKFGALSPQSHETLLRYFVTDRIVAFSKIFREQFPHLDQSVTEQDLALVVNLWEDHRHALIEETRVAPVKPPPSMLEQKTPAKAAARPGGDKPIFQPPPAQAARTPVKAPPPEPANKPGKRKH
ncbi:MAG: PilZ domain-containing protein [Deltaproteobacteria bacterium]|nr:PilZ domain-containing protein [Deltaproteobacteria bacterium]